MRRVSALLNPAAVVSFGATSWTGGARVERSYLAAPFENKDSYSPGRPEPGALPAAPDSHKHFLQLFSAFSSELCKASMALGKDAATESTAPRRL